MKTQQRWANYFIELLIVIIGISIAFWLNNLAQTSKDKKAKTTYLSAIKNDLRTDSLALSRNIKTNQRKSQVLMNGLDQINRAAPIDSLIGNVLEIGSYDFFNPDNFTLKSLIQSGDLKLIDAEDTKRELLRLLKLYESVDDMQNNFLDALDENYFPMLLSKIDMSAFKVVDEAFFYGIEIKNYSAFTLSEISRHIKVYKSAQSQVGKVIKLIDKDLAN